MDTSLTRPQLALFWRKFAAACSAQGCADREAYRHAVLREEGGVEHLADLDRTGGFDRVMLRLCIDAGDWQGASHFETGTERRIAELCADCATQLLQLAGADETSALAYICGILRQARLDPPSPCGGDWWLDVPQGHAVKCSRFSTRTVGVFSAPQTVSRPTSTAGAGSVSPTACSATSTPLRPSP